MTGCDLFDMSGRVAIVSGSAGQLGGEYVRALLAAGASVAGVDLAPTPIEHDRFVSVVADITDRTALERALADVLGAFGRLDVLVNNAALDNPPGSSGAAVGPFEEFPMDAWDRVVDVNLKGMVLSCQVFGGHMAASGGGSIINISSVAGSNPAPNAEPYGAAKAGLNNLTRSFAFALGPKVRINSIMAGPFLTDIAKAWDMEAFKKRAENEIALRRGGQAHEIVGAALYFASDASSFTTGSVLRVDGGTH